MDGGVGCWYRLVAGWKRRSSRLKQGRLQPATRCRSAVPKCRRDRYALGSEGSGPSERRAGERQPECRLPKRAATRREAKSSLHNSQLPLRER